jgi:hypothetical protein
MYGVCPCDNLQGVVGTLGLTDDERQASLCQCAGGMFEVGGASQQPRGHV